MSHYQNNGNNAPQGKFKSFTLTIDTEQGIESGT